MVFTGMVVCLSTSVVQAFCNIPQGLTEDVIISTTLNDPPGAMRVLGELCAPSKGDRHAGSMAAVMARA